MSNLMLPVFRRSNRPLVAPECGIRHGNGRATSARLNRRSCAIIGHHAAHAVSAAGCCADHLGPGDRDLAQL
jgi:hypothetical protein